MIIKKGIKKRNTKNQIQVKIKKQKTEKQRKKENY